MVGHVIEHCAGAHVHKAYPEGDFPRKMLNFRPSEHHVWCILGHKQRFVSSVHRVEKTRTYVYHPRRGRLRSASERMFGRARALPGPTVATPLVHGK